MNLNCLATTYGRQMTSAYDAEKPAAESKSERLVSVRISSTVAEAYKSRCPEKMPKEVRQEGKHVVDLQVARLILDDALIQGDTRHGPKGMASPARVGYSALAKQIRLAILKSTQEASAKPNRARTLHAS